MKRKGMIILAIFAFSMLLVSPAFSKKGKTIFSANGKITHYPDYDDPNRGSEVVDGQWSMKIVEYGYGTDGGVAYFQAYYKELNLDESQEYSPEGTNDHFKISYTDHYKAIDGGNIVTIWGTRHMDKKMWFLDEYDLGTLPGWFNPDWIPEHGNVAWIEDFAVSWVKIEINLDTGELKMDNYPILGAPDGWNLFGTVLSAK